MRIRRLDESFFYCQTPSGAPTLVEMIEAMVEIKDKELIKDKEYSRMGKNPVTRVKTLLGKLDSIRASNNRGCKVSKQSKKLFHKFVEQLRKNL